MATRASSRRRYDQYCAVARGLDVIGERWTLLLIRDLLLGPMRYKDLLAGHQGIGTNLLAERLRELEAAGIVERRVLPPPAGSSVYQLTESGKALEPALIALGRWGARFLGAPRKTDVMVPRAYFVAMRARFKAEAAAGLNETYEFRIGNLVFEVRVAGGRCSTAEGPASNPDVTMTMDVDTLNALLFASMTPAAALAAGRVDIKGDPKALERFINIFGLPRLPAGTVAKPHAVRSASVGARRAARNAG